MYASTPTTGTVAWQVTRRGFKQRYVLRDTTGPVLPDQGPGAARQANPISLPWGVDDAFGLQKRPRHRGGITAAPAPVPAASHVSMTNWFASRNPDRAAYPPPTHDVFGKPFVPAAPLVKAIPSPDLGIIDEREVLS